MANPQKENGYTPIANELIEQIYGGDFNATQLKIILAICRYTYGFNRKSHTLSLTFLSEAIGMSKRYISSELQTLINRNVILVISDSSYTKAREYSINKHYDMWESGSNVQQVKNSSTVEEPFNSCVEELFTTTVEESFYQEKQNIKQNIKQDMCIFFERVWSLYPNKKGKGQVSVTSKRTLFNKGYETVKTCIERYIADKPEWQKYQNGSTFFNSGYIDYLDENYIPTSQDNQDAVKMLEKAISPTGRIIQ